jgi:hypothetical protein
MGCWRNGCSMPCGWERAATQGEYVSSDLDGRDGLDVAIGARMQVRSGVVDVMADALPIHEEKRRRVLRSHERHRGVTLGGDECDAAVRGGSDDHPEAGTERVGDWRDEKLERLGDADFDDPGVVDTFGFDVPWS